MSGGSLRRPRWRRWAQGLGQQLHELSLFWRLVLLGALFVFTVFLLVTLVTQFATSSLREDVMQERLRAAQVAAAALEETMGHALRELQTVATGMRKSGLAPADLASQESFARLLEERGLGMYTALALLDPQGRLVAGAPPVLFQRAPNLASLIPGLRDGLSATDPFFSPAFPAWTDGSSRLAIAVPVIMAGSSQPSLYLVGLLDPQKVGFLSVLQRVTATLHTGHADLLGPDGRVVISTESAPFTGGDHPSFYATARAANVSTVRSVPSEEEEEDEALRGDHIMAYVPVPGSPLAISVGGAESATFAPVRDFRNRMYLVTNIALGLFSLGGLVAAARMVHPVRVLSNAARRLAQGDLSGEIAVREGGEIGELARDMESMRASLKSSLEEIRALNQDLERRIAERTQELEQRHRELVAASAIAEKVTSFMRLEEVLDHTLESVAEATGQKSLAIFLLDREGNRLTLRAGRGLHPPFSLAETSVASGECLCGQVALTGEPGVAGDVLTSPLITRSYCPVAGIRSVAAFPLQSRERVEGVLAIFSPLPHSLAQQDFRVVNLICHQVGIAIQNARMYEEVAEKEKLAHQILERVINAQEEERKRVARELHDDTGQALTGIALALESTGAMIPPEQEGVRERLKTLHRMTQEAMGELRKMALALRPSALDDLGLVPAVRRYALQHLEPLGMAVEVEGGINGNLDPTVQTLLFRVVQEAINNVARHSRAKRVTIRFRRDPGEVCAEVEDDGVGFDLEALRRTRGASSSLGLLGMQERASLVGGQVTIHSRPGQGSQVTVRVPLNPGG